MANKDTLLELRELNSDNEKLVASINGTIARIENFGALRQQIVERRVDTAITQVLETRKVGIEILPTQAYKTR